MSIAFHKYVEHVSKHCKIIEKICQTNANHISDDTDFKHILNICRTYFKQIINKFPADTNEIVTYFMQISNNFQIHFKYISNIFWTRSTIISYTLLTHFTQNSYISFSKKNYLKHIPNEIQTDFEHMSNTFQTDFEHISIICLLVYLRGPTFVRPIQIVTIGFSTRLINQLYYQGIGGNTQSCKRWGWKLSNSNNFKQKQATYVGTWTL